MDITLNNRNETFVGELITVQELLSIKNFTFKLLVVKINGQLIKRDDYQHTFIKTGDHVTVLHLVSGG